MTAYQDLLDHVARLENRVTNLECGQVQIQVPDCGPGVTFAYVLELERDRAELADRVEELEGALRVAHANANAAKQDADQWRQQAHEWDEDRHSERDRANKAWAERGAEKGRHHETECRLNDAQVEVNRLKTKVVRMAEVAITKGKLHDWLSPTNVQLIIDIAKGIA